MTPLKIAAVSTLLLEAGEQAEPLRPRLKAVMTEPPRRINRIIELALLGAHRCASPHAVEPQCPLYLALTHGGVADNVALVAGVTARGVPPTPVGFINLSSNMPGFYVASTLGIRGSNQALAADDFSFEAALELASLGREHRTQVLIGAVEECAWPLAEHRSRLGLTADRALSESSHWLFVDQQCAAPLATVQWVRRYADAAAAHAALAGERWPHGARLALSDTLQAQRGAWEQVTGLRVDAADETMHSGHWTARRICHFVESRGGSGLLHVSQGRTGCYAVFVTA